MRVAARGVVGNRKKKIVYVTVSDLYLMHLHLQHARVPTMHQLGMFVVPIFIRYLQGAALFLNKRTEHISVALAPISYILEVCISNLGPVTSYPI